MFGSIRKKTFSVLVMMVCTVGSASADTPALTDTQLHAFLGIVTNFVLSDGGQEHKLPLKKTGQTRSYDADGNEITDRSIKDDGYYQKGLAPSYTRNDATEVVTDHITGLEWQDDAEVETITKNWADAQTYCAVLGLDGGGWRLPSIQELQSIADGPLNPKVFVYYTTSGSYWSSTTNADYTTSSAWIVDFSNCYTKYTNKSDTNGVRCVR